MIFSNIIHECNYSLLLLISEYSLIGWNTTSDINAYLKYRMVIKFLWNDITLIFQLQR